MSTTYKVEHTGGVNYSGLREEHAINIHIHTHTVNETAIEEKLDAMATVLAVLTKQGKHMSAQLDALSAEVEANTTVDQSAIVLLNGLSAQIIALKDDPVKLQEFADKLKSSSADLAAAVVANTPADPATP